MGRSVLRQHVFQATKLIHHTRQNARLRHSLRHKRSVEFLSVGTSAAPRFNPTHRWRAPAGCCSQSLERRAVDGVGEILGLTQVLTGRPVDDALDELQRLTTGEQGGVVALCCFRDRIDVRLRSPWPSLSD